jgi:hypothetical protein
VTLRYFAGRTLPEVAALLGIPQSTAEAEWRRKVEDVPVREVKDFATGTSERRAVAKPQNALSDLRGSV